MPHGNGKVGVPDAPPEPLFNLEKMISWVSELTRQPEARVRRRLHEEFDWVGTNLSRALREAGLEPHVWSDGLARFYEQTDAFLYELIVWNRNKMKQEMCRWVAKHLAGVDGRPLEVLSIGDGLGFDSAYLAQAGHRVTYFEVPGCTESFARRVFAESGTDVTVLTDKAKIFPAAYDAVLCLDVLEHLPDPPGLVREMTAYLRPGGRLIIHAPFYLVWSGNPAHLRENRRYSGSLSLYEKQGLQLVDGGPMWNPLVLQKPPRNPRLPRARLKTIGLVMVGWYLFEGRFSSLPFFWVRPLISHNHVRAD